MNFGEALIALKEGKRVYRDGWNNTSQYVEYANNIRYRNLQDEEKIVNHRDSNGVSLAFVGTRGIQLSWVPSMSDILSNDWQIKEDEYAE